jgi:hypothetical protein
MYGNRQLIKPLKATAAISNNLIVKFGAANDTVSQAAAASDLLIGVTTEVGITAAEITAGTYTDVVLEGITEVLAGGTIARGAKITSDANGKAIAAAPAAGTNAQVIGIALNSAVSGDIFPMLISHSVMQG